MKAAGPTLPGLAPDAPVEQTERKPRKQNRAMYCYYCVTEMVVIEKRTNYDVYGCPNPKCGRSRQGGLLDG